MVLQPFYVEFVPGSLTRTRHLDSIALSITFEKKETISTMKSFQIVTLFALIAAAMAFAPNQVSQGENYGVEDVRIEFLTGESKQRAA